jgi:Fe-S cluster biogenesis protein NfuA
MPIDDQDFPRRMQRLESLIEEFERCSDPGLRAKTTELVRTILDLHGVGLERILRHIGAAGEPGRGLLDTLARDDLVGCLLSLYDLHPAGLEERVAQALEKVRPYLRSHGGNVELLGIADGIVRLRMQGSCHGCPSSAQTLKSTIEEAIYAAAPDVTAIEVEDVTPPAAEPAATFVPVAELAVRHR